MSLFSQFQQAYPEFVSVKSEGYVESIATSRISSWLDNVTEYWTTKSRPSSKNGTVTPSQVTVSDIGQETISRVPSGTNLAASEPSTLNLPNAPRGLPVDQEAKETRKALLERRRKECEADEVAVAMAPVLKIPVPYVFYPEQYKRFRTMFPRVTPDPGLSYVHHDHPVAHTATLLGIRHMQQMLKPGWSVLDIYGNPNGNEAYNRFQASRLRKRPGLPTPPVIQTMVNMHSHMDAVRLHTKWGEQWDGDRARYMVDTHHNIPPSTFDCFLSVHTLYYMTMREVAILMNKNRKAKMLALVNYSPEQSGTLYGELKFSKSNGITTQTSPNGERYRHPDVDQWFQTNCFKFCPEAGNDHGSFGISWTSHSIGGPLYVVEIAWCPGELAQTTAYMPPVAPTLQVERGAYIAFVRFGGNDVQLRISNHELASELRHFMTFRDRSNPQTLADLCVKARRITAPDLVVGTRQYDVNDGELGDHIIYAYLVDVPGEEQLLQGVKLLRGDLLVPHAEALKLQGSDKQAGFIKALLATIGVAREQPKDVLKGRKQARLAPPNQNSGGLLVAKRT